MRLWSLHPSYLDRMGLTACWREGLLARKVLGGDTKGYTRHPQLVRFRQAAEPIAVIDRYLHTICDEAFSRGYRFERSKLGRSIQCQPLQVTTGQLEYEFGHLLRKLEKRDPERHLSLRGIKPGSILAHPLFEITEGGIEKWEVPK